MRRTAHHAAVSRPSTSVAEHHYKNGSTTATGALIADRSSSPPELFSGSPTGAAERADRLQQLATIIRQRIESRLPGRVRNLEIRILENTVVLAGECSTYYTKQIAQHAAMGVLQTEHLENAIVVAVMQR